MTNRSNGLKFALSLYKALPENENVFFSPLNIQMCLARAAVGARNNTRRQMETVIGLTGLTDEQIVTWIKDASDSLNSARDGILTTAARIYAQESYPFIKSYMDLMGRIAGIEAVDFRSAFERVRAEINGWVAGVTHNRILNLLPEGSLDALTRMVLVTAIYFKYDWLSKFTVANTKPDTFHAIAGDVTAPMMHQSAKGIFSYTETKTFQAVALPYVGRRLSMICLLPKGGLSDFERLLDDQHLSEILWPLRPEHDLEVRLWMPKFEIGWGTTDLTPMLKSLGMTDAFISMADFSGMESSRELYIDGVYHKAWGKVDEEGSEMAAATATVMRSLSITLPREPVIVRLDRPYLYFVYDHDTETILFMGRQANPTLK